MEKPEISRYTTLDFAGWYEAGTLAISPKFQRREVWKTPARSYFIESLLLEIPIPPIFIRTSQSEDRKRVIREVIDGQQRLRALLDYVQGKYSLSKSIKNFGGRRYEQLSREQQDRISRTVFLCEVFANISDAEVLEVFARVNTYSVPLSAQELRNGRYFGLFKQSAYTLAFEHLEFWRRYRIFSEGNIARMLEVEFTSELMIAILAGQQDKKKSIDKFYLQFDEVFPDRSGVEVRFRTVIDEINENVGAILGETEFTRAPLFYTLFCVISHYLFGIPGAKVSSPKKKRLTKDAGQMLSDAILSLSEKIVLAKSGEAVPKQDLAFVTACLRQTDNVKPRETRFDRLYHDAFGRS